MKKFNKILSLVLVLAMMLSLVACGGGNDAPAAEEEKAPAAEEQAPESTPAVEHSKELTVYTGHGSRISGGMCRGGG